ncbi:hypothetical protein CEXT_705751, partial [Caerostris extrusa]
GDSKLKLDVQDEEKLMMSWSEKGLMNLMAKRFFQWVRERDKCGEPLNATSGAAQGDMRQQGFHIQLRPF